MPLFFFNCAQSMLKHVCFITLLLTQITIVIFHHESRIIYWSHVLISHDIGKLVFRTDKQYAIILSNFNIRSQQTWNIDNKLHALLLMQLLVHLVPFTPLLLPWLHVSRQGLAHKALFKRASKFDSSIQHWSSLRILFQYSKFLSLYTYVRKILITQIMNIQIVAI